MIILALALLSATLVFVAVAAIFSVIAAIIPAFLMLMVVYFVIARRIAKQMETAMLGAQSEMQKGRIDRGIAMLEDVKRRYGYWQFFTKSSIDGQIGSIYYLKQEFDRAKPYLEKAFVRHWLAKGMLGVLYFKKKEFAQMDKVLDAAVRYSSKQGLLWSLWSYCHWKAGHNDKAIEILLRAQKKLGQADERLTANLENLQNNKKMKMRGYGEQWYQFHLEMSPQLREMRTRQTRFVQR